MTSKAKPNPQTKTKKGAMFCARDLERIYCSHRHTTDESAIAEARRLAETQGERILILKVVGIVDKRRKKPAEPIDKPQNGLTMMESESQTQ